MTLLGGSLFQKLSQEQLLTPYVENAFESDTWPEDFLSLDMRPHDSWTDDYFHPSTHTKGEPRYLYYQLHPEHRKNLIPWRPSMSIKLSMLMGSFCHVVIQQKLLSSGMCTTEDIEVPLLNERLHARGHLDIRVRHPLKGTTLPVDIKTANPQAYEYMKAVPWDYEAQLQCYMDWMGLDEGLIFVQMMGYPWSQKEFRIFRDEAILKEVYDKWILVREHIAMNTPPPKTCCGWDSSTMKSCGSQIPCKPTFFGVTG